MSRTEGQGILRRAATLLAAQWLGDAMQAVFLLLLARRAVEDFGNVMLALSLGQILLFCAEFGISQHFMLLLARRRVRPSTALRRITALKTLLLLAFSALGAGFCLWQGYEARLLALVAVISLSYGLDAHVNTYYTLCQSLGRQDLEARLRGAAALLGYGFGSAALLLGADVLVAALFKPLETLLGLGVALRFLRRGAGASDGPLWDQVRQTWSGTKVFTLMALAAILYNKANVFFLQRHGGAAAVAQYSATWQLVDGVATLASSILLGRVLFPLFARLWTTDKAAFTRKAREQAVFLLALALPVTFAFMAGSPFMIPLAFGPNYGQAVEAQPWLSLCVPISFVHNLAYYLLLSMGRQELVLGIFLLGLGANAALCAWLVPLAPLYGAVAAIVLTKALVALLTVGACQRSLGLFRLGSLAPALLATAGAALLSLGAPALGLPPLAGQIPALALLSLPLWRIWRGQARADAVETAA